MEEKSASCSINNLCGVRITSSVNVDFLYSILTTFNLLFFQDLPLFGNTEEIDNPSLEVSGSKFSRWFQGDSGAPGGGLFANQQDSRRSSINEGEFGYLNGEYRNFLDISTLHLMKNCC